MQQFLLWAWGHPSAIHGPSIGAGYKVQTRATQPLLDRGMNFGVRFAFDSGEELGHFKKKIPEIIYFGLLVS